MSFQCIWTLIFSCVNEKQVARTLSLMSEIQPTESTTLGISSSFEYEPDLNSVCSDLSNDPNIHTNTLDLSLQAFPDPSLSVNVDEIKNGNVSTPAPYSPTSAFQPYSGFVDPLMSTNSAPIRPKPISNDPLVTKREQLLLRPQALSLLRS